MPANRDATPSTVPSACLGLTGPTLSVAAACASGNHALAHAKEWLEMGWVDVCLAGACDIGVTPIRWRPSAICGPCRAQRSTAEGPAAVRLRSRRHGAGRRRSRVRARDAPAVLAAAGESLCRGRRRRHHSDAHHLVIPDPDAHAGHRRHAAGLAAAQVNPSDVDYVNAHATGTPVGDICEAQILQTVLGPDVERVAVSSTKSMTGHLLAAAAAVEAIACLTAMTARRDPSHGQPGPGRSRIATSATCRTRPASTRCAWPCRTHSASAATTRRWCSSRRTAKRRVPDAIC